MFKQVYSSNSREPKNESVITIDNLNMFLAKNLYYALSSDISIVLRTFVELLQQEIDESEKKSEQKSQGLGEKMLNEGGGQMKIETKLK